jgi:hypothetical protein
METGGVENEIRDLSWVTDQREMTRVDLDRGRVHGL